ncbi:MAG: hypothetical protein KDA79_25380, partial [Planctomycetaceae bacterium]|nr:hypothetical protein [Planctomycetaceae bacterium]
AYSMDESAARLTELDIRLLSGRITGTAMVPLQEGLPQGADATATLQTTEPLQLEPLAAALAGKPVPVVGRLNLSAEASVPRPRLTETKAWQFHGEAAIAGGTAWGLAIDGEPVQAALQNGTLSLSKTQLSWGRTEIGLAGEVGIEAPNPWSASLGIEAVSLDDLTRTVDDIRPPFAVAGSGEFTGSAKGTLQPFDIAATGDVSSDGLTVAGARVTAFNARAAADRQRVRLTEMKLELYGG